MADEQQEQERRKIQAGIVEGQIMRLIADMDMHLNVLENARHILGTMMEREATLLATLEAVRSVVVAVAEERPENLRGVRVWQVQHQAQALKERFGW